MRRGVHNELANDQRKERITTLYSHKIGESERVKKERQEIKFTIDIE